MNLEGKREKISSMSLPRPPLTLTLSPIRRRGKQTGADVFSIPVQELDDGLGA